MRPPPRARTSTGGGFRLAPHPTHSATTLSDHRPAAASERRAQSAGDTTHVGFVTMSMKVRGLVPTFPNGAQAATRQRSPAHARDAPRSLSKGMENEILSLSEQYIQNLQLQIKVLPATFCVGVPIAVQGGLR